MYGLEKNPKEKFNFDLEVDISQNPKKAKEMMKMIENNISNIKRDLKKGDKPEKLDKLGVLLQGYMSLSKVLTKVQRT